MKFVILSLAATAAIALGAGFASAQPPRYYVYPPGGSLNNNNGFYRAGPPVPMFPGYPTYNYPLYNNSGYNSGFGLTGFSLVIGSGGRVTPLYNYGGLFVPYGYYGHRW
jgi:hypothetical protein